MIRAYIGLGANLGDAAQTLAQACARIKKLPQTQVTSTSSLYRSAPVNAIGPDFINAVLAVDTNLSAPQLLAALLGVENEFGRTRPHRNAPRTLDLDLLLYGKLCTSDATLTLPHPRMHQRAFVLEPLAQIAPDIQIPGQADLAALRAACRNQIITRLGDTQPSCP